MKCPSCNTNVSKIPINWKCPHCGEKLPDPGKLFFFIEDLTEYLQDKGILFWTLWLGIILIVTALFELIFGRGFMFAYISSSMLLSIASLFFGGMLIDMYMKIVLPLRLPTGGGDFIIRERTSIRNIRKATHLAAIVGVFFCIFWAGPRTFFQYFPAYFIVISWFLAFAWSIAGMFLDPKLLEDVRFRSYMEKLGVLSLKRLRKLGTLFIGVLIVVAITYNILLSIPGLWKHLANLGLVGVVIHFFSEYMGWLF